MAAPTELQRPATTAPVAAPRARPQRLRWWQEALVVLVAYQAYEWVRGQVKGDAHSAFVHAKQVIHAERLLWMYHEVRMQGWVLPHLRVTQAADIYYGTIHFIVPVVTLVTLWRRFPERYTRWRNTLVATTVLALFGFAFYPLMPP